MKSQEEQNENEVKKLKEKVTNLTTNNQRLEEALKKAKANVTQAVPAAGGRKIVEVIEQVTQDSE